MNRRTFLVGATSTAAASLAGCVDVLGSSGPDDFDIGMRAMAFEPPSIEISVGEQVVWYNNNARPHTVTAYEKLIPDDATYFASGGFDSEHAARDGYENSLAGTVDPGETYEHTFEVAGTHEYFCVPHESGGMVGAIVVRESG